MCITRPREVQEVHSTEFVEYETSRFQNAYAWTRKNYPRRDSHSIETLDAFDSMLKQYLTAT